MQSIYILVKYVTSKMALDYLDVNEYLHVAYE